MSSDSAHNAAAESEGCFIRFPRERRVKGEKPRYIREIYYFPSREFFDAERCGVDGGSTGAV